MDLDIITYGNVALLGGILQALAHIFGESADFRGMMLTVGTIGFIVALVAYAFQPQKLTGWYWLATVLCVSVVLVVPRANVRVVDRLQNCADDTCITVVNDVPLGLAVLASVTSRIGDELTRVFETRFMDISPSIGAGEAGAAGFPDLNYRANGLMFGSKLIREAARATFPDPNFRFNLMMYLDSCAGPDMSDGTVSPATIQRSRDIWEDLGLSEDPTREGGGNPARFTPTANGTPISCRNLREQINADLPTQIQGAVDMMGRRMNAEGTNETGGSSNVSSNPAVRARTLEQLRQAYERTRLGDGAGDASTMVRQNAMINAIGDAAGKRSHRTNDPTSMLVGLAEAQAKVSTNTAWITGAKVAEEAMPLIRNGIEAILYAAFPFIVLMALVVTGRTTAKLLTSYATTLLWIQLWPPLFAVLNYMASAAAARHLAAAGTIPRAVGDSPTAETGLSLLTAASIYENSISDVAVVGYLVISIPVIAWSLVKGMEAIGGSALAGASAFTGGAHAGASQAATGNISMGNVKTDNVQLAPSYRTATSMTHDDGQWSVTKGIQPGNEFEIATLRQSNTGAETMLTNDRGQSVSQNASLAHSRTMKASEAESRAVGDTFTQAMGMAREATNGWQTSENWQEQHGGQRAGTFDKGIAIRQSLQQQFGNQLSESTLDQITTAAVLSGGASGSLGVGGGGAGLGVNVGASGSRTDASSTAQGDAVTRATAQANEMARNNGVHITMGNADQFVHHGSYGSLASGSSTATSKFDDSFVRARQAQAEVSKSLAEERQIGVAAQSQESESVRTRINGGSWAYSELGLEGNAEARRAWAQQLRDNPEGANQRFSGASHQLTPGSGAAPGWDDNFTTGPGGVTVPDPSRLDQRVDPTQVGDMTRDHHAADPAERFGEPTPGAAAQERVMGDHNNNRIVVDAEQGGMTPGQMPGDPKVNPDRIMGVIGAVNNELNNQIDKTNDAAAEAAAQARAELEAARERQRERR
jgi:conjugal transfer mating pair stabilization protein TraG